MIGPGGLLLALAVPSSLKCQNGTLLALRKWSDLTFILWKNHVDRESE